MTLNERIKQQLIGFKGKHDVYYIRLIDNSLLCLDEKGTEVFDYRENDLFKGVNMEDMSVDFFKSFQINDFNDFIKRYFYSRISPENIGFKKELFDDGAYLEWYKIGGAVGKKFFNRPGAMILKNLDKDYKILLVFAEPHDNKELRNSRFMMDYTDKEKINEAVSDISELSSELNYLL